MLQRKYPITCLDNSFEIILHFISTIFISSFDRSFQLQLLSFHLLSPRTFCGRILLVWRCPTVERKWILFPLHARSPARAILLPAPFSYSCHIFLGPNMDGGCFDYFALCYAILQERHLLSRTTIKCIGSRIAVVRGIVISSFAYYSPPRQTTDSAVMGA